MTKTCQPSLQRVNFTYTLVQLIYWSLFAAFAGYQTALLLGRGFTSGQAGVFAAIRCLSGIVAQPLLGGWADRHRAIPLKWILNVCFALALAVNAVFYFTRPGFWGTAAIFVALGALELNAYPLLDSMRSITVWDGALGPSPMLSPAWCWAGSPLLSVSSRCCGPMPRCWCC